MEEKHIYLLMHGDDIVAESVDDTYTDWVVHNETLMPCGIKVRSVKRAGAEALKNAGHTEKPPELLTPDELEDWLNARDHVRDKARDEARDWNSSQIVRWLSRRVLPLSRTNAKIIYQHLGLEQDRTGEDRAKVAERFNAVSITDNYWLKRCEDTTRWQDVDVRRIPLSESFALVALAGESAVTLSSVGDLTDAQAAAEMGTVGTYPKGCFRKDGKLYVVKGGSRHDVIAEWLSARILSCTNVYGFCDYHLDDGTGSNNFPKTGVLTVYCEVMSNPKRDLIMASSMFGDAAEIAMRLFKKQFAQLAVVDYIIGNPDRHSGNWGFFSEAPDWKFTGLHDIYDNNKAFGPLMYNKRGDSLRVSVVGRGTSQQKTLEEGAMMYKDEAGLEFIRPVREVWFKQLGDDWELYLSEFIRRCNKVGLYPTTESTADEQVQNLTMF